MYNIIVFIYVRTCILQALRVSMEEQRQRQEDEARRVQTKETTAAKPETVKEGPNEEAMLKRALAMSLEGGEEMAAVVEPPPTSVNTPDFTRMSEEEQIAFAMQMSMQDQREFRCNHFNNSNFVKLHDRKYNEIIEYQFIYQ